MAENVEQAVRRVLSEQPTIEARFTLAIHPDSYHHGDAVLFLHPAHEALFRSLRGER